jgi:hypothetical protein
MHPGRSIEPDKVLHRRRNELPAPGDWHIDICVTDNCSPACVDDSTIDVRKVIQLFFDYLKVPGFRQVTVTAAGDRRGENRAAVPNEISGLLLEIDFDGRSRWTLRESQACCANGESRDEKPAPKHDDKTSPRSKRRGEFSTSFARLYSL